MEMAILENILTFSDTSHSSTVYSLKVYSSKLGLGVCRPVISSHDHLIYI